jgi:hypothetical protein
VHQRWAHPCSAAGLVHALKRSPERVFADYSVHTQCLRGHQVPSQCSDVGVAPVTGQQPEHQGTQYIALVRSVAAAVLQWTRTNPALKHAGGCQELGEEHQLTVRRGRRTTVPAHVHAPTQCVNDL